LNLRQQFSFKRVLWWPNSTKTLFTFDFLSVGRIGLPLQKDVKKQSFIHIQSA